MAKRKRDGCWQLGQVRKCLCLVIFFRGICESEKQKFFAACRQPQVWLGGRRCDLSFGFHRETFSSACPKFLKILLVCFRFCDSESGLLRRPPPNLLSKIFSRSLRSASLAGFIAPKFFLDRCARHFVSRVAPLLRDSSLQNFFSVAALGLSCGIHCSKIFSRSLRSALRVPSALRSSRVAPPLAGFMFDSVIWKATRRSHLASIFFPPLRLAPLAGFIASNFFLDRCAALLHIAFFFAT